MTRLVGLWLTLLIFLSGPALEGKVRFGDFTIAAESGSYSVYQSINPATGEVQYVGITSNLEARAAAHLAGKNGSGTSMVIQEIEGLDGLSLEDARAVEQTLIDTYGLRKNGGSLLNRINSISPTADTPYYLDSLFRGQELLKAAGHP